MSFLRHLSPRARPAARRGAARGDARARQYRARRRAIRRAGAVRPHHRRLVGRVAAPASEPAARALAPLIGAWVAFGLFIIVAGALVAWFADRLAHHRRNLVLADYFEHVLQLPLAYHSGAHSGRQMKMMLTGTDTLWWLWVSFFREHFAAFVFIACCCRPRWCSTGGWRCR